jgi:branched-chain amino acid aminotransferase
LQLAKDLGMKAIEDKISIEDWKKGCADGDITEVFACGTAAVVTPVGLVKSSTDEFVVANGQTGPVTAKIRSALLDIQTGVAKDEHNWTVSVG